MIKRVQGASRDASLLRRARSWVADEAPTLVAIPRAFVAAPDRWHAMTARSVHPGRGHRANTKFVRIDAIEGARAEREAAAADEAAEVTS